MTASLLLMACGHSANSAEGNNAETAANSPTMDSCWKQSEEAYIGLRVEVTNNGGIRFVWTNWDKFMDALINSVGVPYPFDAPMKSETLEGIQGKVKGLAVKGHPMSPNLYMLLDDNSVQLYSLYKMFSTWNMWAGSIVGRDIVSIKDEVKDYSITVLIDKNGNKTSDEEWFIDGNDLWSYMRNSNGLQVEHLVMGNDGSISYCYSNDVYGTPLKTYYGTVTNFKRDDGADVEYRFTHLDDTAKGAFEKVDIGGKFNMKANDNADDEFIITPTRGINMGSFDETKLGQPRIMLLREKIEKYLND